tara:strand:- start:402 stop:1685 length:1284 start_codon:yes stop_codon:yes gene_type:complete
VETRILYSTILKIGTSKLFSTILNFINIGLLIEILGPSEYGLFSGFFALLTWVFIFDLGISKGMRNYLTESLLTDDKYSIRSLISTTYISTFLFSIIILFGFWLALNSFESFKNLIINGSEVNKNLALIFGFIMLTKITLGCLNQIYFASQKSEYNSYILTSINTCFFVSLCILKHLNIQNVIYTSICYGGCLITVYFIFTLMYFIKHSEYVPHINFFNSRLVRKIINGGLKIIYIQFFFFLFIGLDRFFAISYISNFEAARLDVIMKLAGVILFPWSIISQPLWSAYKKASAENNFKWIKSIYSKILLFFAGIILISGILFLLFDVLILVWLTNPIFFSATEKLLALLLILSIMWCNIHYDLLFGLEKYKLGIISVSIGLIIKLIVLSLNNNQWSVSVILSSSILAYLTFNVICPIFINKYLRNAE